MKNKLLLCLGIFCFVFCIQNVKAQTELANLINYTLKHSHEIQKSGLQVNEANYMRKEAVGQGLPQIDGSASYSRMGFGKINIPESVYSMVPSEYAPILDQISGIDKFFMSSIGVQVTQLIYSQSYLVGLQTTKKMQEMYGILKNKTEEEVISEVANAYYQTGSLILQMQTIDKSIRNLKEIYKIVDLHYKNDLIKETDVSRLKVTLTNLDVTRQTIQNGIYTQLNYLKALAGMPADSSLTINTTSIMSDFEINKKNCDFIIDNVPSYQALLKQNEVYDQQIRLAKAKFYPTLAAYGKFTYSSYNISASIDKLSKMNTIGLSLSVPIFSSGVNYSKVKQEELKQAQLKEDILRSKDLLTIDYNNAFNEYQIARDLLAVQKDNRELAAKVYKQTSMQFEEGMASMADLLNVNSDFLQADNSYNQQILKCRFSEIKILKSTGNLKFISNTK